MVYDLHRYLARLWRIEGTAFGAVEGCPGGLIYLGLQGAFEFIIGFLRASEVGMADKEALMFSGVP